MTYSNPLQNDIIAFAKTGCVPEFPFGRIWMKRVVAIILDFLKSTEHITSMES
jgi:hypothetical protein